MSIQYTDSVTAVSAITTTGTTITAGFDVSKRQLRSVQFLATSFTSGIVTIRVDVSNDTVDNPSSQWVQYNRLTDNVTNTNAQNDTRVALFNSNSNVAKIYFFPVGDYFKQIRFRVGIVTDGTVSVFLQDAG